MQITLPANDARGPKAVAIATDAGQWLKCRTRDGRKAYGIRSSRDANVVYLTTRTSCTCYDARRRTCKHMLAVQLHCELVGEQQQAATAAPAADLRKILSAKPPLYQTNHLPDRTLCGMVDYRGRVCANPNGHEGAHAFVVRTGRED